MSISGYTKTYMIPKSLQPYAEALKAYEKQALEILPILKTEDILNDPLGIQQSKFGGKPFLPKNKQYPMDESNLPMVMIAQINFTDIPFIEGFPRSGILQFYVEVGFDNYKRKGYEVIYITPDEMKKGARTDFSFLTWNENLLEEISDTYFDAGFEGIYSLAFAKKIDRSSHQDSRFDFLFDGETVEEFVNDFDPQGEEISEVLEYLDFQGCKMNGYAQTEWDGEYRSPLLRPRHKDDIQLLQIAWEATNDLNMDKAINLFISPEDLQNEEFELTYLV